MDRMERRKPSLLVWFESGMHISVRISMASQMGHVFLLLSVPHFVAFLLPFC